MHCCIPTPTTDNNTSTGTIWVILNMDRCAVNYQGNVREVHIVCRVTLYGEWSPCVWQKMTNSLQHIAVVQCFQLLCFVTAKHQTEIFIRSSAFNTMTGHKSTTWCLWETKTTKYIGTVNKHILYQSLFALSIMSRFTQNKKWTDQMTKDNCNMQYYKELTSRTAKRHKQSVP